jgi:hypothetical protein
MKIINRIYLERGDNMRIHKLPITIVISVFLGTHTFVLFTSPGLSISFTRTQNCISVGGQRYWDEFQPLPEAEYYKDAPVWDPQDFIIYPVPVRGTKIESGKLHFEQIEPKELKHREKSGNAKSLIGASNSNHTAKKHKSRR